MTVVLKPNADGSLGLQGVDLDAGGFVALHINYDSTSVDRVFFTAPRAYQVTNIIGRVTVAGSDGSAVTAVIGKAASGTALGSGTALHSSTYNLKGTANANQVLTVSTTAGVAYIPAGTSIYIDYTGVLTAAVGSVTVLLAPV